MNINYQLPAFISDFISKSAVMKNASHGLVYWKMFIIT